MKKILAMLVAISMMAITMTACGGDSENSSTEDTTTTTTTVEEVAENDNTDDASSEDTTADNTSEEITETEAEVNELILPEGVTAEDGDAYLAFGDAQWWLQYGGKDMEPLSYGATVVHIDGDGTYTVGLDASNEDAVSINGLGTINGCNFCAVVIKNGETLFPNSSTSITIDKITIDGVDVEIANKNYNNYEDGHLRANIFNAYVETAPTDGVWTADGSLDGISAQIVPVETFASFSKIEVTFTISGSGASAGDTAEGDTTEGDAVADDTVADDTVADDTGDTDTPQGELVEDNIVED